MTGFSGHFREITTVYFVEMRIFASEICNAIFCPCTYAKIS